MDVIITQQQYRDRVAQTGLPFQFSTGDNIYRVESTPVAVTACSMLRDGTGWYLMRIPKIPGTILYGIEQFFEYVADRLETEVRVRVYYDPSKEDYVVELPNQEVTSATVYTLDDEYGYAMEHGVYPVMDIHSHCRFPAIWSGTDDRNETGNWIFAVIGSLGRNPQLIIRVGTGGYFHEIDASEVFDLHEIKKDQAEIVCQELLSNLEKVRKVG